MKMNLTKNGALMAGLYALLSSSLSTQATEVFPIADNPNPKVLQMCGGLAYDGTNYLAALEVGQFKATSEVGAQLVSPAGTLLGSLVNVGSSSAFPPAGTAAFGGGAFLEIWSDNTVKSGAVDMFGQRISPTGAKLGTRFPLLSSVGSHGFQTVRALGFGGTNFLVVWQDGAMKKSDYRKFQVKTVTGVDDFASMREVVGRRYKRLLEEKKAMPSLILIDGGVGQLHAAYAALAEIGIQPGVPGEPALASIAKREEVLYVHGQEQEPVVLDRRSPVLHLVQMIRDESHRFAVTYHRKRREMRDRDSELDAIAGVGPRTRQRLLEHFGSVRAIGQADADALTAVVNATTAARIREHFDGKTHAQ